MSLDASSVVSFYFGVKLAIVYFCAFTGLRLFDSLHLP